MAREPGYCLHKATGQAYVRLGGQVIYLGEYGSEKSKERYARLKAEWLLNPHSVKVGSKKRSAGPTMADLCLAYLDFAEDYYKASSEGVQMALACKPVDALYSTLPANEFGINQFKTCRQWWIDERGCSRQYSNKQAKRLLRLLKWGVEAGMVSSSIIEALRCVAPLKRGRCDARETEPVLPVEQSLVDATIEFLTPTVADMVRLQQLLGCRPGEVCSITPSMVDRSGDVWKIRLSEHKTAYRGKERVIYCGPKAQAILAKYLLRAGDKPCFSPIESEQQRREALHARRKTRMSCGNVPGSNRVGRKPRKAPGDAFTTGTYARSIRGACKRGKLTPWSPNQLRHSAATAIRREFGIEGAQLILGHSDIGVTQVYAERDHAKAIEIARRIG